MHAVMACVKLCAVEDIALLTLGKGNVNQGCRSVKMMQRDASRFRSVPRRTREIISVNSKESVQM